MPDTACPRKAHVSYFVLNAFRKAANKCDSNQITFAKISFVFNKHASDSKLSLEVGSSLAPTSVFISAAGAAEESRKEGVSSNH